MEIKPLWWKMLVLIGGIFIATALFLSLGSSPKEIEERPSISGFELE
jgi:hypothetical protein|tara:strand:- start:7305 stop:7445 length:141 start_codon:yes stop_codon:yes gene_type:complete